jgi:hypothetical protein
MPDPIQKVPGIGIIHISWGGPDRWMQVGTKQVLFEDHPHFGPILLHKTTHDPLDNQPGERDLFWSHYEAWVRGGKQVIQAGDKVWCQYQTDLQAKRRRNSNA